MDNSAGKCCPKTLSEDGSSACAGQTGGGYCSHDIIDPQINLGLKYWICPRGSYCGESTLIARKEEAKIVLDEPVKFSDGHICSYKVAFPVDAGPTDILQIRFTDVENTAISFGVGTSYLTALGAESILDPDEFGGYQLLLPTENKSYEIAWPGNFFVSFYNRGESGKITMHYSFVDNEPGLEPAVPEIIVVKVTEVIEVEEVVVEEYDFTWVYITAGCVTPLTVLAIFFLCKKCRKQKEIH